MIIEGKVRELILENEPISSVQGEEIKRIIYQKIDYGLFTSFVSGVSLGIIPFLFLGGWKVVSFLCLIFSLVVFFVARYFSLKFLFYEEE